MEKKLFNRKNLITQIVIVILTIILGLLYYIEIEVDSDMSSSMLSFYKSEFLGDGPSNIELLKAQPFFYMVEKIYCCIFGATLKATKCVFATLFMACCFLAFEIGNNKEQKEGFVLSSAMIFFGLIPSVAVVRAHLTSTIVILLLVLYIKKRETILNKKIVYDVIFAIIYCVIFFCTGDKMLIVLNAGGFLVLYCGYLFKKNKKDEKKYIYSVIIGILILFIVWEYMLLWTDNGNVTAYGLTEAYTSWGEIDEIWKNGIPFLLKTIAYSMNFAVSGSWVQPMSLVWLVRFVFLVFAFAEVMHVLRKILQFNSIKTYDFLIVCCIFLSILMYLLNGYRIFLYKEYGYYYVYNGYMACIWFLLPVMGARKTITFVQSDKDKNVYIIMITILSLISMLPTIRLKQIGYQNINEQVTEYMVGNGIEGALYAGRDYTKELLSQGNTCIIQETSDYNNVENSWGYKKIDSYLVYVDEYTDGDFITAWDDGVGLKYGEWILKTVFSEDEKRKAFKDVCINEIVYTFDYDIRWAPQEIKIVDDRATFVLNTGVYRIIFDGQNLENVQVDFYDCEGNVVYSELENQNSENSSYILTCVNPTEVTAVVKATEDSIIDEMMCKVVRAAISVMSDIEIGPQDSIDISWDLCKGEHYIIVLGNNIDKVNVISNDEKADICEYINGKERKIYKIIVDENSMGFEIENTGDETTKITNIYYESRTSGGKEDE